MHILLMVALLATVAWHPAIMREHGWKVETGWRVTVARLITPAFLGAGHAQFVLKSLQ